MTSLLKDLFELVNLARTYTQSTTKHKTTKGETHNMDYGLFIDTLKSHLLTKYLVQCKINYTFILSNNNIEKNVHL